MIFDSRSAIGSGSGGHGVTRPTGRAAIPTFAKASVGKPLAAVMALAAVFSPVIQAASAPAAAPAPAAVQSVFDPTTVIVIQGVPGEEEYAKVFGAQVDAWKEIVQGAGAKGIFIGGAEAAGPADRDRLRAALESEPRQGRGELWLVMIGHGTFDGKEAKFNLRGPDIATADLAEWLRDFERPLAIINTASSSAPFLNKLSGPGRVIVTSTRSGAEDNYARFGMHFVKALLQKESDFDKDGQISLLEAFLAGSAGVAEFYKTEGRLATEHPLLDDNGDTLGTPPDWYRGVRAVKRAQNNAAPDGPRALQLALVRSTLERNLSSEVRALRDDLELKVAALRERKTTLPEDEYYRQLEQLLLQLAAVYPPAGN